MSSFSEKPKQDFLSGLLQRVRPKNTFVHGVMVLAGGAVSAQALLVLATPLLTRLYSPSDFGFLAVYVSLLGLFGVIASLRYELAIPLPENDDHAAQLVWLCSILVLVTMILTGIVFGAAALPIAQALGVPKLASYFWLLPLGILFSGAYNIFRYWALRIKDFRGVAGTTVWQSLTTLLIQIAGFKFGTASLLLGQTAGHGAGTLRLGARFFKSTHRESLSWQSIRQQAVAYKKFPLYSTWEALFNTAGTLLPPLLFAALFSPAAAGFYSLANRVLSMPMSLIGTAIGQTFFSNAANAHREDRLGEMVFQLHEKLSHVGFPPALLLVLVGPDLFALIFGSEWRQAGEFARWMTPWLYLVFVTSPISTTFTVMEKLKEGLAFQVIMLLARLLAMFSGYVLGDLLMTVKLFSISSAICWFGFLLWIGVNTGNSVRKMLQPVWQSAIIAAGCGLPLGAVIWWSQANSHAWLYGLFVSGILVAVRLILLLRKAY